MFETYYNFYSCAPVACVAVVCDDCSLRVNLIPACAVSSQPGDLTYVVARPYMYDLDPSLNSHV